jgi:hypothetical protein
MTPLHRIIVCVWLLALTSASGLAADARLTLKPRVNFSGTLPIYSEDSVNFYGTNLYLLESVALRRRAEQALGHPAPSGLKVVAVRITNTSIILVSASSSDEPASAAFLSALIDEFLKFKREEKKRIFTETIARVDAAMKAAPREANPELQKLKQQLTVASLLDTEPDFEKLADK